MISFISILITLNACAIAVPESMYEWYQTETKPIPMSIHKVTQEQVQGLCCLESGYVIACAYRDPQTNFCGVFTSQDKLSDRVLAHEKKHCDGWDHQVFNPSSNNFNKPQKVCLTPKDVLK